MENGRKATTYTEAGLRTQVAAVARQVQRGKTGMGAERLTRVPPRGLTQLGISSPCPVVSVLPDLPFFFFFLQENPEIQLCYGKPLNSLVLAINLKIF